MSVIIPARFYRGDLDELIYSNPDWWQAEVDAYFDRLSNKPDSLSNKVCVFD